MPTILVADNEEAILSLFRQMLEREGFKRGHCHQRREAVEACAREDDRIALAILDVQMPVMSGPEAVAQLHRRCPGLPVILMSGYDSPPALPGRPMRRPWGSFPSLSLARPLERPCVSR